jgi:hypothetical protein
VPITIIGTGFGARSSKAKVTIGGVPVARYLTWQQRGAANPDLDVIVVQPATQTRGGSVVVTNNGKSSTESFTFRPTTQSVLSVSPAGQDTSTCVLDRPCRTVQHAVGQMRPGDTLLVRGGEYTESEIWVRDSLGHSGNEQRRKTITAYPGEQPVFINADRPFILDADHVTVSGLSFRNGKSVGIPDTGLPGPRGNWLMNNTFTGTISWSAADSHGDDHVFAGNRCTVDGSTVGTQGHCFYVSYGNGARLLHNLAEGAPGYGIHVFDQQRTATDFRRVITNLSIIGNTLRGSRERSGLILAMGDEGGRGNRIVNVQVRDNLLTTNNHVGMLIGPHTSQINITGNQFADNGRQGLHIADEPTISNIDITNNRFTQTTNNVCISICSWYQLAHLQVGSRTSDVAVGLNRYSPEPPVIVR